MKRITDNDALIKLMDYCCRAERCTFDLRRRMTGWEIEENVQRNIISHLIRERFVDDTRFCKAFVNDKSKFCGWGKYKIKYELQKKHIPEAMIEEALENINHEESFEKLIALMRKKRQTIKESDEYTVRRKLIAFFASKGFSFDEIKKALSKNNF
ncbi:MAG: RecX family transcriptional regulator [Dysgonamonadaceae bacterium]|jgi:regulatory protein|nr:RecX family transcriptional regulator [Dysgonamonadaceae bacterium]